MLKIIFAHQHTHKDIMLDGSLSINQSLVVYISSFLSFVFETGLLKNQTMPMSLSEDAVMCFSMYYYHLA